MTVINIHHCGKAKSGPERGTGGLSFVFYSLFHPGCVRAHTYVYAMELNSSSYLMWESIGAALNSPLISNVPVQDN